MSTKSDLMSGAAPAPSAVDPTKLAFAPDPALLALAERFVAEIKTGKITSFAGIIVGPSGQVQWPAHGLQATELYLGAGLFQRFVEGMVTNQKGSRILGPGG